MKYDEPEMVKPNWFKKIQLIMRESVECVAAIATKQRYIDVAIKDDRRVLGHLRQVVEVLEVLCRHAADVDVQLEHGGAADALQTDGRHVMVLARQRRIREALWADAKVGRHRHTDALVHASVCTSLCQMTSLSAEWKWLVFVRQIHLDNCRVYVLVVSKVVRISCKSDHLKYRTTRRLLTSLVHLVVAVNFLLNDVIITATFHYMIPVISNIDDRSLPEHTELKYQNTDYRM